MLRKTLRDVNAIHGRPAPRAAADAEEGAKAEYCRGFPGSERA